MNKAQQDAKPYEKFRLVHCPKCGSIYWIEADEGRFAHCEKCGFEQYPPETLQLMAEVKREQAECKRVLGYIPDYREAKEKGFAK